MDYSKMFSEHCAFKKHLESYDGGSHYDRAIVLLNLIFQRSYRERGVFRIYHTWLRGGTKSLNTISRIEGVEKQIFELLELARKDFLTK